MKNIFFFFTILLLSNCATQNKNTNEAKQETLWVNSLKVPCTGVAPMNCLQIQKGETLQPDNWEFFYDNIEGFAYQAGYIYKLLVKMEELNPENVPADASSIKYTLIEIMGKKSDTKLRINDIWAVESIMGEPFKTQNESPRANRPVLEIHIADKRIIGNDGCNQIFGKLEKLTETEIQIGEIGGTKMACLDMATPQKFREGLAKTATYEINNLKLILFDENGEEVMGLRKVD